MKPEKSEVAIKLFQQIADFIVEHSFAPTVREVMVMLETTTTSVAAYYLSILKDAHWIDWQEGKSRTITLLRSTDGLPALPSRKSCVQQPKSEPSAECSPEEKPLVKVVLVDYQRGVVQRFDVPVCDGGKLSDIHNLDAILRCYRRTGHVIVEVGRESEAEP